jgi:hypothetical protein
MLQETLEQSPDENSTPAESEEGAEQTTETTELDEANPEEVNAEDSEEEDVEFEGKQYRVPKELKDALLRQSDYTRKTQEAAEIRKQAEAYAQRVQVQEQFQRENITALAKIHAIDEQLSAFANLNWNELADADPVQAMKLDRQARQLQAQREQHAQDIAQKHTEFTQRQQQEAARSVGEGLRVLQREIPGWGRELAEKLVSYGMSRGYSEASLRANTNPSAVIDLYRSFTYDEARKKATSKPVQAQDKPVTRISTSKGKASVDPERMSAEEWVKWRNSTLKKSR